MLYLYLEYKNIDLPIVFCIRCTKKRKVTIEMFLYKTVWNFEESLSFCS